MTILSSIPLLHCQSIEDTLVFYQQALQFVIVKKRESEGKIQWVELMNGSITLMLQRAKRQDGRLGNAQQSPITLYFFINNIKELHRFFKVKYNKISDLVVTDYQIQECSVHDPEGNKITLGQKLK